MIFVFLVVMLLGLGAFVLVFIPVLKRTTSSDVSLQDRPLPVSSSLSPVNMPQPPSEIEILREAHEQVLMKVSKQEVMLEEKNKAITALQEEVDAGREQQGNVDNIKQILQAQIDELKGQNKRLKDELTRVLDENMDLQTRLFAVQALKVAAVPSPSMAQDTAPRPGNPAPTLSLHDVFGGEGDKGAAPLS